MTRTAILIGVLVFSAVADAAAKRQTVKIEFTNAPDALAFADGRSADAQASQGAKAETANLEALTAYHYVALRSDTAADDKMHAAIGLGETYLRMGAARQALSSLAVITPAAASRSARLHEYIERGSEAAEFVRPGSGAGGFANALKACGTGCSASWKTLIRYRAGVSAVQAGVPAAAILEESVRELPADSPQAIHARAALVRAYIHADDLDRAQAHLTRAKQDNARALRPATAIARTYVKDPTGADLSRYLDDTDRLLQAARAGK